MLTTSLWNSLQPMSQVLLGFAWYCVIHHICKWVNLMVDDSQKWYEMVEYANWCFRRFLVRLQSENECFLLYEQEEGERERGHIGWVYIAGQSEYLSSLRSSYLLPASSLYLLWKLTFIYAKLDMLSQCKIASLIKFQYRTTMIGKQILYDRSFSDWASSVSLSLFTTTYPTETIYKCDWKRIERNIHPVGPLSVWTIHQFV